MDWNNVVAKTGGTDSAAASENQSSRDKYVDQFGLHIYFGLTKDDCGRLNGHHLARCTLLQVKLPCFVDQAKKVNLKLAPFQILRAYLTTLFY